MATLCICLDCLAALPVATPVATDYLPGSPCTRPSAGDPVSQPANLREQNGELHVALTIRSSDDGHGHTRYCYLDPRQQQAPTLRVRPGDMLYVRLLNRISPPTSLPPAPLNTDPCSGGAMSAAATNLHFHGLSLPPVCHQDETLRTLIQPGAPSFEYRVRIGQQQPPGLYWYHPHVHGFSEQHLLGGASGAIVVEGIERVVPEVRGLPERILILRDDWMSAPPAKLGDPRRPTKQLSINYVPVNWPAYVPARLQMQPGGREFWRVVNASADSYLYLYVEFGGKRELLGLVARDGVPLGWGRGSTSERVRETAFVFMPPGGRAEFIVRPPDGASSGKLMTGYVQRGADDDAPALRNGTVAAQPPDQDPTRPLAAITVSSQAAVPLPPAAPPARLFPAIRASPGAMKPVRLRTLFFSEAPTPEGATAFFITEQGHEPAVFEPGRQRADIVVRQGDVEDWKIENRSREDHAFHVHQLHFIVVGRSGQPVTEPDLLDTVDVPAWRGYGFYPSVTLRMDFRDPRIVGVFPFHCHIAQHLDGGMMGTVRVLRAPHAQASFSASGASATAH